MASLLGWLGKTIKDTENNVGHFVQDTQKNVGNVANSVNQSVVQPIAQDAQKAYHTVQAVNTGVAGAGSAVADKLFNGGKNYQNILNATRMQLNNEVSKSFVPQNVANGTATPLQFGKSFASTGVHLAPYAIPGVGGGLTKALGARVTNGIANRVADTAVNRVASKVAGTVTKNTANAAVSVPTFSAINAGQQLIDNGGKSFDVNQANQAGLQAGAMTLAGGVAGDAAGAGVRATAKGVKAVADTPKAIRKNAAISIGNGQQTVSLPTKGLTNYEGAPDAGRVAQYKEQIQQGKTPAPLVVVKTNDGKMVVEDGKHRLEAYGQLGIKNVPAVVVHESKLKDYVKHINEGGYVSVGGKNAPGAADNLSQSGSTPSMHPNQHGTSRTNGLPSDQAMIPGETISSANSVAPTESSTAAPQRESTPAPVAQASSLDPSSLPVEMQKSAEIAAQQSTRPAGSSEILGSNRQVDSLPQERPGNPAPTPRAEAGSPSELRSRGFIETIKNDKNTPQEIKDSVSSLYTTRNTKELQTKAANLVKDSPDTAHRVALSKSGDISQMVGSELIKHYGNTGEIEKAIELAHVVASSATEHGRASQALSAYSKLTPEGILRFAQKEIGKYNEANKLLGAKAKKLAPADAQDLLDRSQAIQKMPEGRAKDLATAEMLAKVHSLLPAGWVKKASTLQTIGQLLNVKTATRNILGNAIFGGLDNVAQVGAAGIDKVTSKVLGTPRTTALPNLATQAKGVVTGGKAAIEETIRGVNLGPDTQFQISDVPVFKSKFMQGIEKTLGISLKVPDRAAYQATFDDTVKGLMKANKLDKPTQEIIEQANANGLYRTFQDESNAAQLFSKLKSALNFVGFEKNDARLGLGDLILKYPKTPGNIIARGLDYSPVGIVKGLYQIVKPAISKQPFNQHTFVNSISRGTIGTGGLVGAGAVLGSLGIITEAPNSDTDTRNLQKASGQGGYQINVDALRRFFLSGFDKKAAQLQKGDTLVSYDWAQPLSIPLSAGAAIGKGQNPVNGATSTVENLAGGLNTLVEQPLVTGVSTFANNIKNYGVLGAAGKALQGAPASFVPTIANQTRQLTDNTTRSTYDPSGDVSAINQVVNKIPGLSKNLPAQVDTLGNDKQNYQNGSNNLWNVMVNPSFVSQYNPNAAAKLPLDILAKSGETQQMPRTINTTQSVNGQNVKVTPQQNHDLQQYVGQHTNDYYNQLLGNKDFLAKTPTEQAKIMSSGLTDIAKAGKVAILGDGGKVTAAQSSLINGGNTYKSTGATKSGVTIAPNLDKQSASVLTQYSDATARTKAFQTDPKAEYNYNQAKYNNDKANGSISDIQDIARKQALAKDQIGSDYSKDARDLYSMSKANITAYVNGSKNGADLVNQLKAYDQALYNAGIISTPKFKNGIAPTTTASRTAKTATTKGRTALTGAVKPIGKTKVPTFKSFKSPSSTGVAKAVYKKPSLKQYSVKLPNVPVKKA